MGALVREAIDARFPSTSEERRGAAGRILSAEPMPVADENLRYLGPADPGFVESLADH